MTKLKQDDPNEAFFCTLHENYVRGAEEARDQLLNMGPVVSTAFHRFMQHLAGVIVTNALSEGRLTLGDKDRGMLERSVEGYALPVGAGMWAVMDINDKTAVTKEETQEALGQVRLNEKYRGLLNRKLEKYQRGQNDLQFSPEERAFHSARIHIIKRLLETGSINPEIVATELKSKGIAPKIIENALGLILKYNAEGEDKPSPPISPDKVRERQRGTGSGGPGGPG